MTLNEIKSADRQRVGGKAFNCAVLKQAGIPVPDGIVITTDAMDGSLELPELDEWLQRLRTSTLLAVRSSGVDEDSAGFSFAGIHETKLNVQPADVPASVRECWASIKSPKALAYRRAQGLPTQNPKTAVLIQQMIQPIASGVAFTTNPVTGATDELLINSVFGLGEALVSGVVQPDEFRLRKASGELLSEYAVNTPPSLDAAQLRDLAGLLQRIETYFHGTPQDVEWCHDGSQFWIVQSRPVTTAVLKRDTEWTRANVREVLPDIPSAMTSKAVTDALNAAQRKFGGRLVAPFDELGPSVKVFYGRMYFNVDQMRNICRLTGTPAERILRSVGHEGDIRAEDRIAQRPALRELLRVIPDIGRIVSRQIMSRRIVRRQVVRTEQSVREMNAQNLATLSDREKWPINQWWRHQAVEDIQLVLLLAAGVSTLESPLHDICKRVGFSFERLVHTHLAAGEKSVSTQQAFDLLRLAQIARAQGGTNNLIFKKHFEEFTGRYGHRGHYETDVAMPRYKEDPSPWLFAIQSHATAVECPDPDLMIRRQDEEAAKAFREFEARLTKWQRLTLLPRVRWLLRRTKQFYLWRERCRSDLVRITAAIRARHLELGRRFVERGWLEMQDDYFFLIADDVEAVIEKPATAASLRTIVIRRKAERVRWSRIEMPTLMRESQLPALARRFAPRVEDTSPGVMRGLCVSPGYAEAEVVVMRDPSEFAQMKRGAILVAPATDPSWTPLFTLASGLIVEVGGMLSHASTVAREYGLPALANVRHATKILKSGDRVKLDATNGVVQLCDD